MFAGRERRWIAGLRCRPALTLAPGGPPPSDEARATIEACTDAALLDQWIVQAASTMQDSLAEVLAPAKR
jgi:hypothetical protein